MNLKDQLCTEEQAKILKDLGVSQVSLFYYLQLFQEYGGGIEIFYKNEFPESNVNVKYSAYTVAELGLILRNEYFVEVTSISGLGVCTNWSRKFYYGNTVAECLGALAIEHIKKKRESIQQINERLLG